MRWMKLALSIAFASALLSCGGGKVPVQVSGVGGQGSAQPTGDRQQIAEGIDSPREASLAETLSELNDLEAPAGVDESSFLQLKAGLHKSLLASRICIDDYRSQDGPPVDMHALMEAFESARFVSAAPGEGGRVDDLELIENGDGTYTLTWTYRNVGDYNQDGIVDIKDLSVLAAHFGESWQVPAIYPPPPGPPYDGNEDGVVDIKDLTPIAANFFCDVAGYAILGGDSLDGEFTEVVLVRLSPPEGEERIRLEMSLPQTEYKYFAVRAFGAGGVMGELSNVVERNLVPVAVAGASPTEGKAPLTVTFACWDSYDPDGSIVTYEWDFDGDGEYDWESTAPAEVEHIYRVESEYQAQLRVTDNQGATAVDGVDITVGKNQPPVAVAGAYPTFGNEPLTVIFRCADSYDPDGTIVDYSWDFYSNGIYDWRGTTAGPVNYTYEHFGIYTAKLRVTDDKGAVDIDTVSIRVNGGPIAYLEASPTEGKAPLEVHFDARDSVDVDRTIAKFEWDWDGNGWYDDVTSAGTNVYTYFAPGMYAATVRVWDEDGLTDTDSVSISVAPGDPPTINSVTPTAGLSAYPLTFIADVSGAPPLTFRWNFGGGAMPNEVSEQWPTVTLGAEGSYEASVTVTNDYGEDVFDFTVEVYAPGPGDWAMFGRDVKHRRMSPYLGAQTGSVRWALGVGIFAQSSPAIGADGTVYLGSAGHCVYAIGREGMRRWKYTTDSLVTSSPAIGDDGTVYVGSWDHFLYAINPDGTLKWLCDVGGEVESSPAVVDDGTVYVGSNDGNLYAINPDGTEKWRFDCGWRVFSTPAFDNAYGVVYVGGRDGWIYAITDKGTEGNLKWKQKTEGQIFSSPAIGETGTVYIGSHDGYLYAVYPSGTPKWKYEIGSGIYASPGIGPSGIIFVGAWDGSLYAIGDMPSGPVLLWTYETGADMNSSPAVDAWGDVYVGSDDGYVYCIKLDGSLKWSHYIGDYVFAGPVIADDGTVYASSFWNGMLHAFGE